LLDGDTEWRVLVADGRIVAWERRVARPGEWRANVSLGATVSRPDLPEAVAELAVAAHVAIDLDYSGVDVLVHEEVAMVIELSASPAWEGAYSLWHDALFELYTTALASCLRRARDADPFQAA
jgi:glutathione synthase/RimK-type ligase-like ATP-grasp enzyme